ncbi:MAG: putative DNA binding domain-containing protein [Parcubacteria group bacterium]|nr:putative DNA binding domain-containing protein [Parcubacteria group bacterium]
MFQLFEKPTIKKLLSVKEGQTFDCKKAQIDKTDLSNLMIGFANADGGIIAIGIEESNNKNRIVGGIQNYSIKEERFLGFPSQWIIPPIKFSTKEIACKNHQNKNDKIILIEVEPSDIAHANRKDEMYLRMGDKNIKLNFEQRQLLVHDKGMTHYELSKVKNITTQDLNEKLIKKYTNQIQCSSINQLLTGRNLATLKNGELSLNLAGILLFAKQPEKWLDYARIRFLRYEGLTEKTGERINITKDIKIFGPLPIQIRKTEELLNSILREFTTLNKEGKFVTTPEYPKFAWYEAIVNAVVHRGYDRGGADIQIKMFDDRLEIISPGRFPGLVREENIRDVHFSRNPKIARVMTEMGFVRELGEGVNRMIEEMKKANLPEPSFKDYGDMVTITLQNKIQSRKLHEVHMTEKQLNKTLLESLIPAHQKIVLYTAENKRITTRECREILGKSRETAVLALRKLSSTEMQILIKIGKSGPKIHYILHPRIYNEKPDSNIKVQQQETLL